MSQACAILKKQVELDFEKGDGTTLRKQMETMQKMTGEVSPELIPPNYPFIVKDALKIYNDLRWTANSNPITYVELKAYEDLTENILSPRDVMAIMEFDRVVLIEQQTLRKKAAAHNTAKTG